MHYKHITYQAQHRHNCGKSGKFCPNDMRTCTNIFLGVLVAHDAARVNISVNIGYKASLSTCQQTDVTT